MYVGVNFVVNASCTCRKRFLVPGIDVAIELRDVALFSVPLRMLTFSQKKKTMRNRGSLHTMCSNAA